MLIVAFVRLEKLPSGKTGHRRAHCTILLYKMSRGDASTQEEICGSWGLRRGMINSYWWAESFFVCYNVTVKEVDNL